MKIMHPVAVVLIVLLFLGGVVRTANTEESQPAKGNDLVIYYSYTGNTELVGKTLAEVLKADTLKIEDVKVPTRDEAYGAGKEAALQGKAWPIKPFKTDLTDYKRVFVGCPVWFSMPTPQFNAFVEQVDFAGKQVVIFVTLGGGNPDKALKNMTEKIEAKRGKVVSSFSIKTRNMSKDDLAAKAREIAQQYLMQPKAATE